LQAMALTSPDSLLRLQERDDPLPRAEEIRDLADSCLLVDHELQLAHDLAQFLQLGCFSSKGTSRSMSTVLVRSGWGVRRFALTAG
jgi:hypothetical protein